MKSKIKHTKPFKSILKLSFLTGTTTSIKASTPSSSPKLISTKSLFMFFFIIFWILWLNS
jgi:hypothetical protein